MKHDGCLRSTSIILLSLCCLASGDEVTQPSGTVFFGGLSNIDCYRIPAVAHTPTAIVAFAEARIGSCSDGAVQGIATRRSIDEGVTWSDGVSFAVGNASFLVGNPTTILSPDGKGIFLFYVMHTPSCKGDCGIGTGYVVSVDGGLSWSEPCDISIGIGPAAGALPGPGAGVTLSSGRMMFAAHHSAYVRDYVVYSDDKGVTWRCLNQSFPSMDEPALAVMANGSVQLNMRHKLARERGRAVSWSHDGGNNFGPIQYASALISPVCEASMATITTGSGITSTFFANPASTTGRDHISVRRTSDSGGTWTKAPYLVQAAPTFGYTALLSRPLLRGSLPEGGLLFESVNATIAFTAFPLDF